MNYYLVGEVILWASPRIPVDFLPCDGRLLSANQYLPLFQRLGYSYGGSDGQFALPNLPGPTPTNGRGPLAYLIAIDGLYGPNESFTNAGGVLADIRFLAGQSQAIDGAVSANGATLQVSEYEALSSLLSTRFGGDGVDRVGVPTIPPLQPGNGPAIQPYLVSKGYFPDRSRPIGEVFIAEIRLNAASFTLGGWLPTTGGTLPIRDRAALYSLILDSFGGNAFSFDLPILPGVADVSYKLAAVGLYPYTG